MDNYWHVNMLARQLRVVEDLAAFLPEQLPLFNLVVQMTSVLRRLVVGLWESAIWRTGPRKPVFQEPSRPN